VTITSPVVSVDLAPTFLDMAGVTLVDDDDNVMDGISFLARARKKKEEKKEYREFLVEYTGEGGHVNIDKGRPIGFLLVHAAAVYC
jgi:arylsulfatase A-like enzyme